LERTEFGTGRRIQPDTKSRGSFVCLCSGIFARYFTDIHHHTPPPE
jgi:hypothetical protein